METGFAQSALKTEGILDCYVTADGSNDLRRLLVADLQCYRRFVHNWLLSIKEAPFINSAPHVSKVAIQTK